MGAEISEAITKYAALYDMTQDDVHKFLASRDSLETIAGLLGLMPWYGGKKQAEGVINALSAYLTECGYEPPQKWCRTSDYLQLDMEELPTDEPLPDMRDFVTKNKSSQYRGVSWYSQRSLWCAYVYVKGKRVFHGYFQSEAEAALAYNEVALEHHGDKAKLNKVERVSGVDTRHITGLASPREAQTSVRCENTADESADRSDA